MILDNIVRPIPASSPLASLWKRQLQWLLLLRVVMFSLLFVVALFFRPHGKDFILPSLQFIAYFVVAVYLFTGISVLALNKTRRYQPFTYLQLLTDTLLITFLVYFTGGSRSVLTIIYLFPIITGGLMLFRAGGLIFAAMSTLEYGAVLCLEYLGYSSIYMSDKIPPVANFTIILHHFSVHGLIFFMVALLTIFLSERLKQTEAVLSKTAQDYDRLQSLYKQIFDDITTGIITVNEHGEITSFNRASEDITGYSQSEVIGQKLEKLFPDFITKVDNSFRQAGSLTKKNGNRIPVGYSWTKLNLPDTNENSRVYTMQDLSQIKKMENQVRQAEKMAAIGEMAAGVAHEFRNPLAAVSGAAQMLGSELIEDVENQRLMNIIIRECDRLETTIAEFLQFSKPLTPEKKWFSIKDVADESIQIFQQNPNWDHSSQFTTDFPYKFECWGDPAQIKQVLLNLIDNACTALAGTGGEIFLSGTENKTENNVEETIITIANNGPPIPANIVNKIFEPFFTTREKGTGLGLAIVWQIIKAHGGTIKVGKRAEEGTSFIISLPLP